MAAGFFVMGWQAGKEIVGKKDSVWRVRSTLDCVQPCCRFVLAACCGTTGWRMVWMGGALD